jgi:hypothetical protein
MLLMCSRLQGIRSKSSVILVSDLCKDLSPTNGLDLTYDHMEHRFEREPQARSSRHLEMDLEMATAACDLISG